MNNVATSNAIHQDHESRRKLQWCGVLFAMVFPSLITWAYFVSAGKYSTGFQQAVFLAVKIVQFGFPLVWVWAVLRVPLRTGRLATHGLLIGAAFSLMVVVAGLLLFQFVLREMPFLIPAAELIRAKITGFGVDSAWKYAILAVFYSLFHSLLEEYYWRWFVFRQLRQLISLWPAVVASALAFTAHHVIVLNQFFQGATWLVVLFSTAVAIGGAFWAWLYNRTDSLFAVWLSHLLIDAGIFWIGYNLVRDKF